jgi:hypothetical protein
MVLYIPSKSDVDNLFFFLLLSTEKELGLVKCVRGVRQMRTFLELMRGFTAGIMDI